MEDQRRMVAGTRPPHRTHLLTVASLEDVWKINDEWWRGPDHRIERTYFDLLLQSGKRIAIFHDITSDTWHRQSP